MNTLAKGAPNGTNLPYMCLVMIVKNESHIIIETLTQLKAHIDYWVICDTGSTDDTKQLITQFFAENKVPGDLVEHQWRDFGHNRTLAFQAARGKSKYAFVFDADDKIHGNFQIPKNLTADAYLLKFGDNFQYTRLQIFRNNLEWVYRGVLHEFPSCKSKKKTKHLQIDGKYYIESRRLGSRNHDPKKYEKDAQVLLDAIASNTDPDLKPRYAFYLAQSYKDAKDYTNAIKYYTLRTTLGGWSQECFYSAWQVGLCMEKCVEKSFGFHEISRWYLKAFEFCGHRGESLSTLGSLCYKMSLFGKAVFYLTRVSKMPIPDDSLFCVKSLYGFECQYPLCLALNKLEKFQASTEKCARLLESLAKVSSPNDTHRMYIHNLSIVQLYNSKQTALPSSDFSEYTDFDFYPNKDIFGSDIFHIPLLTIPEMIQKARSEESCSAFNSLGYFKDLSPMCGDAIRISNDGTPLVDRDEAQKIFLSKFIHLPDTFPEDVCNYAEPAPHRINNIVPIGIFIKKEII